MRTLKIQHTSATTENTKARFCDMIAGFKDEYRFLSNFYNTPVTYNGVTYKNSEAAFQAAKFTHLTPDDIRAKVSLSIIDGYGFDLTDDHCVEHAFADMSAADAKKLGRKLPIRPDWEDVKFDIMREIIDSKFANNAYLKRKLLATGKEQLVERNWWHDNIWGDCACDRCDLLRY